MGQTLKCTEEECGHEFSRSEAELDWEVYVTEPDSIPEDNGAEFHIDVQVKITCPECGSVAEDLSGETLFTVELG